MTFQWSTSPVDAFNAGIEAYAKQVMDALYAVMVEEADNVQAFMRANAVWTDDCMPGREYLRAVAFRDDENYRVGITAFYDLDVYRANCPEPEWDWGIAHETYTFKYAGDISIILPNGSNPSVLGDEAPRIWQRIEALFQ